MNTIEYQPLSKEEMKAIEHTRGAVQVNGGHLVQHPFMRLNPNDYPKS